MSKPYTDTVINAPFTTYTHQRRSLYDSIAAHIHTEQHWSRTYHQRIIEIYRFLVTPGQRVLELGCGRGDLLAALEPAYGVGVDFSRPMVQCAAQCYPSLHFIQADAHELSLNEPFDTIILSDLVNDLWDVQRVLQQIIPLCTPRTRIILNSYSRVWERPLGIVRSLGMARPNLPQNWLTREDLTGLLNLVDCEVVRTWQEVLWPLPTPGFTHIANKVLVKTWPLNQLALTNFIVARPAGALGHRLTSSTVAVVIPTRNEAGNIPAIFERTPELGAGTELIFVEGHSKDNTYEAIAQAIQAHPERTCTLLRQQGKGKGDAVRTGFAAARSDILMILDADLTMPPEDLPRYYELLCSGKAEFVNGVRLVYPMEQEAMRFLNLVGNKFFSLAFSYLLGQSIKDTLCGTKVLWRDDYLQIARHRSYFGDFDPFGDFDLLFGAARLNLKIRDLPIRYRERIYGTTNINRWRHGLLLLRMTIFAAGRMKFI
ncbi:glycosyltransferase [Candidatus Chloroploca sp. M-50]|uniref:Glycosyltransferase n=1 Tax=Candidatus Chloroploca mongolica TaxID=2528176 RepID=A0ABS4DCZ2_9CHLR|nr:glycosyltransferase [Candidatus Chloroploca mongolica]MBP1467316.1 glycosyltransferase [Candidatus Chloroploca mongolica]